jgi:hypothetical protein
MSTATKGRKEKKQAIAAIHYAQAVLSIHLEQLQGRDVQAEARAAIVAQEAWEAQR